MEIMIAMSIFTVIIVAVYSSWAAIVRGAKSGLDAAAAAQRSRIAIRTIEDALLTTQLRPAPISRRAQSLPKKSKRRQ